MLTPSHTQTEKLHLQILALLLVVVITNKRRKINIFDGEARKHRANDPKCSGLGWVCIPLAVETYGNWGKGSPNYLLPPGLSPGHHHFLLQR